MKKDWFVFHGYPRYLRSQPLTRPDAILLLNTVEKPLFMQKIVFDPEPTRNPIRRLGQLLHRLSGLGHRRVYPKNTVVAPVHKVLGWIGHRRFLVGPEYFALRNRKAMVVPPRKLGLKALDKRDRKKG